MRYLHRSMLGAAMLAVLSGTAFSQEPVGSYPSKPVVLIVPIASGGPIDQEARLYAKMTGLLGQPFVVDYKPGAGTTIGAAFVARSAPDGYTLLVNSGGFTTAPALYKDLSFDIVKDFAPISLMSEKPYVLISYPGSAHSPDNISVWLPQRRILYAGCMARAEEGLGNVAGAELVAELGSRVPLNRVTLSKHIISLLK